jgi:mono/diheme cytochrome c family protein
VLLLSAGCGKPDPGNRYRPPDQELSFNKLFEKNCAGCHGVQGVLGPAPPLADPLFLAIVSDDDLRAVIAKGRRGTPMPAFDQQHGGLLTTQQVAALIAGLRQTWGKTVAGTDGKLPAYRQAEAGDAGRGAKVFDGFCARCHGQDGRGGTRAGALNDWAFLQLVSDQRLRRTIITGRSDLGMPGCADHGQPMTDQQIADAVALLASWRSRSNK